MATEENSSMQYKNFTWPKLPSGLKVEPRRHLVEFLIPGGLTVVQDFGDAGRRITGEGSFLGADAISQYLALESAFRSAGSGSLVLPGFPTMNAVFFALEMTQNSTPEAVFYRFEFRECEV